MSLTIMVVLALAANTSFGGLPVLASLLARNNYLPHLYALRDDRQVFASGIWTLAILSGALLVAVGGNTLTLIPLYAIGVFTGFTLSQGGLVVHWRRTRPPRWRYRASLNGLGAAVTAVATVVFLATKFTRAPGLWCWRCPRSSCCSPGSTVTTTRPGAPSASAESPASPRPGRWRSWCP